MNISRRTAIASGVVGALAVTWGVKPTDHGAPHNTYFKKLTQLLTSAGIAQPTLLIDQQRFDHNIQQVKQQLSERKSPLPIRLVVKSLPSLPLLDYLAKALNTQRFMVFNMPMLSTVSAHYPQADFLFGKPMAHLAVSEWLKNTDNQRALPRIQWLVDSLDRLKAYAEIAKNLNKTLRINLELDVGLHRGGFASIYALKEALELIKQHPLLQVSGLMAYEAHVAKMPTLLNMQANAWQTVQQMLYQAKQLFTEMGYKTETLTINSGGSQTYTLHAQQTYANEIAIGTAFVQPSDFDLPTLSQHQAASFIATPVLKVLDHALIPALEWADGLRRWWDVNSQRGYFIHGGHWLAQPESPQGLALSGIYGRSSNQELLLGSPTQQLTIEDYVFFRPQQSEAVFLQFGDIVVVDTKAGKIMQRWPVFPASA